ncbi:endonuclease/exonuclease/phosphatase family protein [Candidatus Laterigemmans baculatus]|uniref:endonuclease/exonuclease/phosphatase family protein n=1 Tax=Candidatus Laterigemmans baculatus TaxID=2770505 RepID=UPI0013DAFE55|nr:endonuclease/exonuclease/phosphatase family protein [Candidatus Laterigemmans baculatus]
MTWNLEWFYDNHTGDNFSELAREQSAPSRADWNWRRDAFAKSIAAARPDVLAVQEVEGQRVLYYLTGSLERNHQLDYQIGFIEGGDYFTEQDVGFLYQPHNFLTRLSRHQPSRAMEARGDFGNVTKHAEATFEVPVGDGVERVTILTLHFRAGRDAEAIRTDQTRSVHAWLAERIAAGENVIVLGDTNSLSTDYPPPADSDIAILSGRGTPTAADDLVDLGEHLPESERPTHLREDAHLDRILVSRSLLEDTPRKPDLVFHSIERLRQLAIRGDGVDEPEEHWERYWQIPEPQRDLSDHWPLVAKFTVK